MWARSNNEGERTRQVWAWLKRDQALGWPVPVFLGHGDGDKMREAHQLLEQALPADHVVVNPGAHEWKVWRLIFQDLVDRAFTPLHNSK